LLTQPEVVFHIMRQIQSIISCAMKKSFFLLSLAFYSVLFFSCEKYEPPEASFNCDKTSGSVPLSVAFTSTSQGDISSFEWDFGDGGSSTSMNPTHVYSAKGSYTARLTVVGPGGEDYSEKTISVSEASPVAGFSCDKTTGTAPLTVNFTSTSTGSILSYAWDFGDGGTSSLENPSHTFTEEGNYTVKLTVSGLGGSNSATKTITVSESAPVASFTCNKTSGNAPLTVNFTSTATGTITSHSWSFGDGGTSSSTNPSHTYNSAGTYTASLTVTGPGGSNTATETITVSASAPVASFTCNKTSGDAPLTVNFTSTSTGTITSHSWSFGDGGTSSSTNPSHTYNSAGTYTASLTVTGPGGSNTASKTITVSASDPGTNIKFNNNTHTAIKAYINGSLKTVAVGGSATFYGVQGSTATFYAYTYGKTDVGGSQIGLKIEWDFDLSLSGGGETDTYNLNISSTYFFIYMRNSSPHTLVNLYVNYGLVSQTVDYISISNSGTTDPLGYYKAYTNSNVRIYWQDNMSVYYYWNQGTHFTLPWTNNQSTTLIATSKSGDEIKSKTTVLSMPGISEMRSTPLIFRSDPDAKDLYCK
jgi:PKD repeat protein